MNTSNPIEFNSSLWQRYKDDSQSKVIQLFDTNIDKIVQTQSGGIFLEETSQLVNLYLDSNDFAICDEAIYRKNTTDQKDLSQAFVDIIDNGIYIPLEGNGRDINLLGLKQDPKTTVWFDIQKELTITFYLYNSYFIPALFDDYATLFQISDKFGINLPPHHDENDHRERLLYYLEVCEALHKFAKKHQLSQAELCAFLYDFAPKHME